MKKILVYTLLIILTVGCKEKYTPDLKGANGSYLVVEGFINSGTGPTTITVSRSTKLSDTATIVYEKAALVRVEDKNGTGFQLGETSSGVYSISQLSLNTNSQYRVYIKTKDNKEYVSDYSEVRRTPDIDSLSWKRKDGGVQNYVNTHDNQNKTKFYQWKYDETWEFRSSFIHSLVYTYARNGKRNGVKHLDSLRPGIADTSVLICWKSTNLASISIGSSEQLDKDVIFEHPTSYLPSNSEQLSVLYSINVKQYALSEKNYRFLQQLKKNTEQLGSIFDAQPSDNRGNMHCVTNPDEQVLGFIEVTEEKVKRIFIRNSQVPDWKYKQPCDEQVRVLNDTDSLEFYGPGRALTTVAEYGGPSGILFVYMAPELCTICTKNLDAKNKKPAFWP